VDTHSAGIGGRWGNRSPLQQKKNTLEVQLGEREKKVAQRTEGKKGGFRVTPNFDNKGGPVALQRGKKESHPQDGVLTFSEKLFHTNANLRPTCRLRTQSSSGGGGPWGKVLKAVGLKE